MAEYYVGEVRLFPYNQRTMVDWMPCDGRSLAISTYQVLFAVIGTAYGGDGQTTFKIPDLRGRTPIHRGQGPGLSNYAVGAAGGVEAVSITEAQMPAHTHSFVANTNPATSLTPSNTMTLGDVGANYLYCVETQAGTQPQLAANSIQTQAGAGSAPHNNIQPTIALQYCIATGGLFPSPN